MNDSFENISDKFGLPPGTLVHVGKTKDPNIKITLIEYDENNYQENNIDSIEAVFPFKDKPTITWLNIDGLNKVDIIRKIGEYINIHVLTLEDILNTNQRPKIEEFDNYLYIVMKEISLTEENFSIEYGQLSIILGKNFVITFTEGQNNIFDSLKNRIKSLKSRFRKLGPDYLAYAIIDLMIDRYFVLQDVIDELIEKGEENLLTNNHIDNLYIIQNLKREIIFLRRSVSPVREMVNEIIRSDFELISNDVEIFFRDVYDHIIRVSESLDLHRDLISGMLDIYLSSLSNKTNEIMKVLTIFAAIFIPLTFIAGIYGMNFDYMPELKWKWSYPVLWIIILVTGGSLLYFFNKKKWL